MKLFSKVKRPNRAHDGDDHRASQGETGTGKRPLAIDTIATIAIIAIIESAKRTDKQRYDGNWDLGGRWVN